MKIQLSLFNDDDIMTTEEKAKRYDEALAYARNVYRVSSNPAEIQRMVEIFPELKESEDERIRKDLITWLKNIEGQALPIDRYNAALAWIEKQGKKPQYRTELKESEDELLQPLIGFLKDCVQIDKGYFKRYGIDIESILNWLEKQGEQQPAWSEEDEEHYKACLQYFDEVKPDKVYYNDYQWFKSLKQRIGG